MFHGPVNALHQLWRPLYSLSSSSSSSNSSKLLVSMLFFIFGFHGIFTFRSSNDGQSIPSKYGWARTCSPPPERLPRRFPGFRLRSLMTKERESLSTLFGNEISFRKILLMTTRVSCRPLGSTNGVVPVNIS